ncbi:MAG: AMP-binding protein [Paraburkholderia sp.]
MNLGHLVTQASVRYPERMAVIFGDVRLTWSAVNQRIDLLVAALRDLGVQKGDRVLVQARNSHRMFETKWACFKAGAVWVPVNFRLTESEVAYITNHSGASLMFHDAEFDAHAAAAASASTRLKRSICYDRPGSGTDAYEALLESSAFAAPFEAVVEHDDPAWFFYTSGTTGRPKAAVLTHGQLAFVTVSHLADMFPGTTVEDTSLVIAPLSHGAGVHALAHVARATTQVLYPNTEITPERVWEIVQTHMVTNFFAVPTLLKKLVEHHSVDMYDHSTLRRVNYGGAPMYRADQKLALTKLGSVLVQHFGLGEFTANITVLAPEHHSPSDDDAACLTGSCGVPRTGIEVAILAADARQLPSGVEGEICARGPAAFAGYFRDEDASRKAFRDGWFHTGDIGHVDERGFVYVTGRQSDMYISGGLNVYPREVEEILLTHPQVSEVAVVGMPDPQWGESGVAVLVTADGQAVPTHEFSELFANQLAKYKWPKRYEFWAELPKSAYGKILKREIRSRLSTTATGVACEPDGRIA